MLLCGLLWITICTLSTISILVIGILSVLIVLLSRPLSDYLQLLRHI